MDAVPLLIGIVAALFLLVTVMVLAIFIIIQRVETLDKKYNAMFDVLQSLGERDKL